MDDMMARSPGAPDPRNALGKLLLGEASRLFTSARLELSPEYRRNINAQVALVADRVRPAELAASVRTFFDDVLTLPPLFLVAMPDALEQLKEDTGKKEPEGEEAAPPPLGLSRQDVIEFKASLAEVAEQQAGLATVKAVHQRWNGLPDNLKPAVMLVLRSVLQTIEPLVVDRMATDTLLTLD